MRLKRLELFGFKSFADRSQLGFDPSLVGIVGPNGCGKSNVVDAVRWVLGETRPTSMRGGEMTDVIFKGSASRPPLAVAEVTLVLDNTDATIEGRGAECSVTRRVYRSGEGEYLIDGERVRLKDVREMLYGTGLGSRGYSVLEQGKIDAILSANPLERRTIFEEAAGISRYRQRKKESESRLKRVEADLLRVDDVLRELERRKRSLKIQAGKAERYREARERYLVEGLRLANHQVGLARVRSAELGAALEREEREVEGMRERRKEAEAALETREGEQEALSGEVERTASDAAGAGGELRALDERRAQLGARIDAWRQAADEEGQRVEELGRKLAERNGELAAFEAEIGSLAEKKEAAGERVDSLAGEVSALSEALERCVESLDTQNERCLGLLSEKTSKENHAEHLTQALPPLEERAQRAEERREEHRVGAERARSAEGESASKLRSLEEREEELRGQRSTLQDTLEGLDARHGELEARAGEAGLEIARLQSRVETLSDWEEERSGLEAGAQKLLEELDQGGGPAGVTPERITGLFADHLHPDTHAARAIDAALGTRAQALVVARPDDARNIVSWLKERAEGRVSLVFGSGPRTTAEGRTEPPPELLHLPDVLGPLPQFARPEPGFERLSQGLLGDALLVRGLARARELAAAYPDWRFVTPEGDLVDVAGEIAGHIEVAQGPVGRRSVAASLEEERHRREEQLEHVKAELEALASDRSQHSSRLVELDQAVFAVGEERSQVRAELETHRARHAELARALAQTGAECAELVREREVLVARRAELSGALRKIEERLVAERLRLEELENERSRIEQERGLRARSEAQARLEAASLGERLEAARRQRGSAERAASETRSELERTRGLAEEHGRSAEDGEGRVVRLLEERDEWLARKGELEERLAALRERERSSRQGIDGLRNQREELTRKLEGALAQLSESRLDLQRVDLEGEEVARRAAEDFELVLEEWLGQVAPDEELEDPVLLQALENSVRETRASLEKLGPVNPESLEELEEVEERLGFLGGQRADLEGAKRSLQGTLKKLNEESERRFVESFEEIREHFRALFRQLFGGGKADIRLMEGAEVLEAGIEITARPPGRETLPITLLSGGQRTLTALALLFAVFRTHPSPFCILDEVDAALDDANIARFLGMLEHTNQGTQFIIVTHNKGTMAACRLLYGVTMAVRGVSRVVSVELDEVEDFVPDVRGPEVPSAVSPAGGEEKNGQGPGEIRPRASEKPSDEDAAGISKPGGSGDDGSDDFARELAEVPS